MAASAATVLAAAAGWRPVLDQRGYWVAVWAEWPVAEGPGGLWRGSPLPPTRLQRQGLPVPELGGVCWASRIHCTPAVRL